MNVAARGGRWERRLERDGLRHLDYDDGAGGIKVGNRGSGKVLDGTRAFARASASEELRQRTAVLQRVRGGDRDVYELYAAGMSTRAIAGRLGVGRMSVFRTIGRVERLHRSAKQPRLGDLVAACEPATLILFFALLERALESPGDVRALIGEARAVPELRALIEPDEVV